MIITRPWSALYSLFAKLNTSRGYSVYLWGVIRIVWCVVGWGIKLTLASPYRHPDAFPDIDRHSMCGLDHLTQYPCLVCVYAHAPYGYVPLPPMGMHFGLPPVGMNIGLDHRQACWPIE